MKKYLIKGALALFAGGLLFSCAETESEYVPLAQQKSKAFEDVFKEIYGDVDPYQDWGFSSGKIEVDPNDSSVVVEVEDLDGDIAYTRMAAFGGVNPLLAFNTGTRAGADGGENKNLNEWGDPAKNNGVAYKIPPALTDGQKLRVRKYFQENPNLTYVDPHYTTFFVQQVYKGNPQTKGSLSPEEYVLGNGDKITGSDHMDHLTFGLKSDGTARHHVNDFNHGDWNNGVPLEVLNTGKSANDYVNDKTHVEGVTHPDQITLMVNSSTERVGYAESNASVQHNYCCALAGAAEIDAWAAKNGNPGEAVTDGWNRSFVGLDYEAAEDPYYVENGSRVAAKVGDIFQNPTYAWTGSKYIYFTDDIKNQTLKQYFNLDQEVYYLKTEKNNWAGTASNYSQQSDIMKLGVSGDDIKEDLTDANPNSQNDVLDLTKIKDKVIAHCLPVKGKGFQEWYTNIGARDYVFSDWIVTLTNAGTVTVNKKTYVTNIDTWTQHQSGRVFCEDLGQASREDLDYNDVVFDVTIWSNYTYRKEWWEETLDGAVINSGTVTEVPATTKYYANIKLLAAGGTIPVTIKANKAGSVSYQVHNQFKPTADVATMINTRDNNSTAYGSFDTREPVQIGGADAIIRNYRKVKNVVEQNQTLYQLKLIEIDMPNDGLPIKAIDIISSFGTAKQVQVLQSDRGTVPRKFMAPIGTKWASERKNISLAYPDFGKWVKGGAAPWSNVNTNYTYNVAYSEDGNQLPLVMKAQRTITKDGETFLWKGSIQFGSTWNLRDASASLVNQELEGEETFDKFYPGDRLRFYGENIGVVDDPTVVDKTAWITVVVGDVKPYFIDSEFPNYVFNAAGQKETRTSGCVEVLIDENGAEILNKKVSNGKINFQVQGRNFVLTGISRVLFQ